MKLFNTLLALLALSLLTSAASMPAPAVDTNGEGIVTIITADVSPGNGYVHLVLPPYISTDTQQSMAYAAAAASDAAGVPFENYDYYYSIETNAEVIDGPSGGVAMGLAVYSELAHRKLRSDMAATGTIDDLGVLGTIGGVVQKADALAQKNITLLIVPFGQSQEAGIDLSAYGATRGIQIVEARSLREAIGFAFTKEGEKVNYTPPQQPRFSIDYYNATSKTAPIAAVAGQELNRYFQRISTNASSVSKQALEEVLNNSRELYEKGYSYSAANLLFVTQVSLDTLDLATANTSRESVRNESLSLRQQLESYEFKQLTIDNFEIVAGAQLRAHWAEDRVTNILDALDHGAPERALYRDLALARNWARAAKALDQAAPSTGKTINELTLRSMASTLVEAASRASETIIDEEGDQHLQGARTAFSKSRYAAAILDATLAGSFYHSASETANLTSKEQQSLAINASQNLRKSSELSSAWAEAYQAHALYDLEEGNRTQVAGFYEQAYKLFFLSGLTEEKMSQARTLALATPSPTATEQPALNVIVTQQEENNPIASFLKEPGSSKAIIGFLVGMILASLAAIIIYVSTRPSETTARSTKEARKTKSLWRRRSR
ncbi:MAG TPA: S16 family serine protease [Candidatus Norongarragalinales archaeon]|jgi:predicted S18 family serine protease|nr:S16 family serine protease [Candidatus Norongarragalinales archaeon]